MKFPKVLLSTFTLLVTFSLGSIDANEHMEHEEHGVHEHGFAKLNITVAELGLEIMLESPAANLVGFEHTASSDEDKKKLADTKAKLEAGTELFVPNAEAECSFKTAVITSSLLGNPKSEAHQEKKPSNQTHENTTEPEQKAEAVHSDIDVTWLFACAKPAELKTVDVKLLSAFPNGLQKINAAWLSEKGASAQELTEDSIIKLH